MSTMNIEVRVLTGRTAQYNISQDGRVRDLQDKIAEREGLTPESQYIIADRKRVTSEEKLGEIGMQECKVVHLLSKVTAGMSVTVKVINGEIKLEIEENKTTVMQLKSLIEEKKGIPPCKQRLVMCDGQTETEMMDKDKVNDYMKEDALKTYTISLVMKEHTGALEPLEIEPGRRPMGYWSWCLAWCC